MTNPQTKLSYYMATRPTGQFRTKVPIDFSRKEIRRSIYYPKNIYLRTRCFLMEDILVECETTNPARRASYRVGRTTILETSRCQPVDYRHMMNVTVSHACTSYT